MIRLFPVALEGAPHYSNDFGVPGQTGKPHHGIDIFADEGAPIVAVDDGDLRYDEDPMGGHAFYLRAPDGTVYYGAHLASYEGTGPRAVAAGDVLGYVGNTGNAAGGPTHLHFEMHPAGGVAVNPYPWLSALSPVSVLSSHVEAPPAPPAPIDPLPPIGPLAGPVPPIPHAPARGLTRGEGTALGFLALGFTWALARRAHA